MLRKTEFLLHYILCDLGIMQYHNYSGTHGATAPVGKSTGWIEVPLPHPLTAQIRWEGCESSNASLHCWEQSSPCPSSGSFKRDSDSLTTAPTTLWELKVHFFPPCCSPQTLFAVVTVLAWCHMFCIIYSVVAGCGKSHRALQGSAFLAVWHLA